MGKNIFNSIKVERQRTNTFDLTHDVKFSSRMGELTPVLVTEVLPGDSFKIGADSLIRFAPLIAPVMHRFDATIHYFFVPNRIIWENFPEFLAQQAHVHPTLTLEDTVGSLTPEQLRFLDYMGVPPITNNTIAVNALPFAAYQCIYNEYYRDQNLITEVDYQLSDGPITPGTQFNELLTLRKRAWQHDYFTSSLPFAQRGPEALIPLGDVQLKDDWTTGGRFKESDGTTVVESTPFSAGVGGSLEFGTADYVNTAYDPNGTLESGTTTINNLRRAFKLQEWLEKNARAGIRYVELILSHFGVRSSDQRLQRPEYITGVKQPIVVSEVLNTAGQVLPDGDTGDPLPQGNMSGHAVSVIQGQSGSYRSEEHGFIIGIMSVMPKPAYMQGLHRQFSKLSPFDYYWPSFAHLGEQEVKAKEIYVDAADTEATFGYVPRYAEYKYIPSRVAGQFRSTLDYWHLARKFASEPTLSQQFIECDPDDLTRIFAVETGDDELFCHVLHKITARRPMPVYGTPML